MSTLYISTIAPSSSSGSAKQHASKCTSFLVGEHVWEELGKKVGRASVVYVYYSVGDVDNKM